MNKLLNFVLKTPPLKREIARFILCCLIAIPINVILFTGVDETGEIKGWAVNPINVITSTVMLNFMVKYLLPALTYTIIKAIILNANKKYAGLLSFFANQVTGALYCAAIVCASLSYQLYIINDQSHKALLSYSVIFAASGAIYFYALQCAIQKTTSPKLL